MSGETVSTEARLPEWVALFGGDAETLRIAERLYVRECMVDEDEETLGYLLDVRESEQRRFLTLARFLVRNADLARPALPSRDALVASLEACGVVTARAWVLADRIIADAGVAS